jgi:hypothetical protein
MAIPAGVETVTVSTGGVPMTLPDGTWLKGSLTFTGPGLVTVGEDDFVVSGEVEVPIADGQFSVTLVATDATGMSPTGWTYTVASDFDNAADWTRYISLPKAAPSVRLADVLVPDPVAGTFTTLVDPSVIFSTGTGDVVGKTRTAYKTADEPVDSATLQDDNHLAVSLTANAVYALDMFLDVEGDSTADITMGWAVPAGTAMSWTESGPSAGNGNNIASIKYNRLGAADSSGVGILPTGTAVTPSGNVRVGATGGTLTFRWAQTTTNAIPTILKTGSWLRLHRMA